MSLWPDPNNPPRQTREAEVVISTEGFCLLRIDYERTNMVRDNIVDCSGYGLVEKEPGGGLSQSHYHWLGSNIAAILKVLSALKEKESTHNKGEPT